MQNKFIEDLFSGELIDLQMICGDQIKSTALWPLHDSATYRTSGNDIQDVIQNVAQSSWLSEYK